MKSWIGLLACFVVAGVMMATPSSAQDEEAMVVGRVSDIKGDLLRYVPSENDWVAVVKDAPFGTEDTLSSGNRGMAELIVPNGTWIRIGNSTQIQFITLATDLSEIDVASGVARFYNKSSNTILKATSPFGYVLAYPGTVFDFYVGDDSVEVVPVTGNVSFIHLATEAKYEVSAGSPSILADQRQVSSGEGDVDPDWDRWNRVRDDFWAAKARTRGRSAQYLPPSLHDESYALDENGRWEKVYYQGTERWFWRPVTVVAGWGPFTVGRWTDWYGDQTWIPAEPFGYVTHHYGNWVYVGNTWYWAPPVVSVRVGMPFLDVGFHWYPGRVSWIHTGVYVGWVPLAPYETYYCYRPWGGPRTVVVNNVNITEVNVNVRNYAYVNRAIVVNQNDFYRVNNYRNVQVANINRTTIINNYRAAPVVNNTVINNYTTNRQRYNYTNVKVNEKPHNTVINRIQQNEKIIHEGRREKASVVQEQVKSTKEGRISREARVERPKVTNYIVPASEVTRPKSEIKLQQKEMRRKGEGTVGIPASGIAKPEPQPGKPVPPGAERERVKPMGPSAPRGPQGVQPAGPGQPEKPRQMEKPVKPTRPSEPKGPQSVQPTAPGQPKATRQIEKPVKPVKPSESQAPQGVRPTRPEQPEKPRVEHERVKPAKPSESRAPEGVQSTRPEHPKNQGQTEKPGHQENPR